MAVQEYHSGRLGHRHGLMLLTFLGCVVMYAARVGLSVSMVAMTVPLTANSHANTSTNKSLPEVCPMDLPERQLTSNSTTIRPLSDRQYAWSSETQGILHGSFFYGYLVSQIPGGWFATKIGAKIPIAVSMLLIGLLTILSPFAADMGVWAFFLIRLLVGFFQGVIYPSITVLWREWAPPAERGRLLSMSYAGFQIGTVMGMLVAGYLAQTCGWESIYYCFGTLCIAWVFPWWALAYNSPNEHPTISEAEQNYIVAAIHPDDEKAMETVKQPTPWLEIFKTVPVWALLIVEFGHNWGFYTLLTNLPTYLNNILHFSLKSNGALSAMPYLCRFIMTVISVFLSDWIRSRNFCTPTTLRKAFSIGSFVGGAVAMIGVAFAGCDAVLAVVLFTAAVGCAGTVFVGHFINYSEMSPNYGGILIGLGNTVGATTGIIAPYVVGVLVSGEGGQSVANWQGVFFISAGLYAFVATVYAFFGSAVRQPWDSYRPINSA